MPDDAAGSRFDEVAAGLRAGDPDAAAAVFRRYAARLVALARARLGARVRAKEDPEDVVQSAYRTFFRRHAAGEFEFAGWDGLWALLALLTARKCGRRAERYAAGRRDIGREADPGPADGSSPGWEAEDPSPTPDEAAALAEAVEGLLRPLGARDRAIVELALRGHTAEEAAAAAGCSTRTAERVLARVREKLERARDADG